MVRRRPPIEWETGIAVAVGLVGLAVLALVGLGAGFINP